MSTAHADTPEFQIGTDGSTHRKPPTSLRCGSTWETLNVYNLSDAIAKRIERELELLVDGDRPRSQSRRDQDQGADEAIDSYREEIEAGRKPKTHAAQDGSRLRSKFPRAPRPSIWSICRTAQKPTQRSSRTAIDIPIGLLDGSRAYDNAARKLLGQPRGTSIFAAPCRAAISAPTHASASQVNREKK